MTWADSADAGDGLASYLRLLSTYPSPDDALRTLIDGPTARLDPWGGLMWLERGDVLEVVAGYNVDPEYRQLYARLPIDADMPVPLCFRESEVIVTDVASMPATYVGLQGQRHAAVWDDYQPDGRSSSLVQIPMVNRGVSLGVVGIACRSRAALDTLEISFLDGLGAALGLWVTHPATPLPGIPRPLDDDHPGPSPALTARQRRIVQLISEGRSNAAIAVQLACSVSTVKQDIQRIQRAVRAPDRARAAERAIALGLLST